MPVPKFVAEHLVLPVPKLVRRAACAYGSASPLTHTPTEFFPTCLQDGAANQGFMVLEEAEFVQHTLFSTSTCTFGTFNMKKTRVYKAHT
jgi:hypothetical protein